MPKIFVSYSRVDKQFAERLVERLRKIYGYNNVWYDQSVHGGDVWWEKILDEIAEADIFLYLLSNDSVTSPYCQAEFTEAQRLQKALVTVQVRDRTKLTGTLRDIQYIDMSSGAQDGPSFDYLLASINMQAERYQKKRPRWRGRTPRPDIQEPEADSANRDDVTTPDLKPVEARPTGSGGFLTEPVAIIIAALITGGAALGAAWIALGGISNPPTPTTDPLPTRIVIENTDLPDAPTDEPGIAAPSATSAPDTPGPTIDPVDLRLTELFADATASEIARLQTLAPTLTTQAETRAAQNATATADRIETLAVERLLTAVSRTPTPTSTFTPSSTPTPTDTPTPTPTPTATPDPIEQALADWADSPQTNDDWTPLERTIDGAQMMLVPPGSFQMGSPTTESGRGSDEDPHSQTVDAPFWIDRYEVTNADFAAFLNAQGNRSSEGVEYLDDDSSLARIENSGGTWRVLEPYAQHPVTEVTWFGARDYCAWRHDGDGRLPTEKEWEYAASGPSDWVYPWDGDWDGNKAVHAGNNPEATNTAEVGSKPGGASWVGAEDLAGNVWEWNSSLYASYPYDLQQDEGRTSETSVSRVLRGGSWDYNAALLRAANRFGSNPDYSINNDGFRCARLFQ